MVSSPFPGMDTFLEIRRGTCSRNCRGRRTSSSSPARPAWAATRKVTRCGCRIRCPRSACRSAPAVRTCHSTRPQRSNRQTAGVPRRPHHGHIAAVATVRFELAKRNEQRGESRLLALAGAPTAGRQILPRIPERLAPQADGEVELADLKLVSLATQSGGFGQGRVSRRRFEIV
jgi:hypothetical protein